MDVDITGLPLFRGNPWIFFFFEEQNFFAVDKVPRISSLPGGSPDIQMSFLLCKD